MVYYKFQKAMKPMRIQNLTLSDGIKTVQNIDICAELSTVVPTKSDSDVILCLQLLSKTLP